MSNRLTHDAKDTVLHILNLMLRAWRACGVAGAAFALLCGAAVTGDARAQTDRPALWKIAGAKSNVYLFGSFHMLPAEVKWLTPALEQALEEAEVIALEVLLSEMTPQGVEIEITRSGLQPKGQNLFAGLPEALRNDLRTVASELDLPAANLAPMRPWLAALTLSMQFVAQQGFDPRDGVELQVEAWARENKKEMLGLESAGSQLGLFGALSKEEDTQFLAATLRQIHETPKILDDMLAAYRSGDTAKLNRLIHFSLESLPQLRQRLFRDRHVRWLPQIEKMLATGRTHLIVVGAGHLVGPDSVVDLLRKKGIKVEGP